MSGGRAFPVVLSAPSGSGKTTIARTLLDRRGDVGYSVSCTTRAPRSYERDGVDYHFLTVDDFDARVAREEFAEWADVHGKRYGTLKSEIERVMADGKHVMLDIDVQGARQVVARFPEALTVFVVPPSVDALRARLAGRNSETPDALALRLRNARRELEEAGRYQYVVVNDDLEHAVQQVGALIDTESQRSVRQPALGEVLPESVSRLVRELQSTF